MNSIRSKQLSVNKKEGMFGNKDVKIQDKKDNELNVQTYCFPIFGLETKTRFQR